MPTLNHQTTTRQGLVRSKCCDLGYLPCGNRLKVLILPWKSDRIDIIECYPQN